MATDYRAALAAKIKEIPSIVKTAKGIYSKYGREIDKYRGGMPAGFAAAISAVESGGNASATGDASLGEFGLLQVAASTEKTFGVPNGTRYTPTGNLFLGLLEYNVEAQLLSDRYPEIIPGTWDQWFLARLVFAVGRSGTYRLIDAARAAGYYAPGGVFGGVQVWADKTGAMALGSSSAAKIWYRINFIPKVTYPVAQQTTTNFMGPPIAVASPPGIRYALSDTLRSKMKDGSPFALVALAAAGFFLLRG